MESEYNFKMLPDFEEEDLVPFSQWEGLIDMNENGRYNRRQSKQINNKLRQGLGDFSKRE